ncbi:MAG: hypothetical protein IAF94_04070 [Pirellulaceae bacterium]|nr:hypothetical protein [Pirellulaceae bacterium]
MKYSLRSLMIAVTLLCVGLGAWFGRTGYLRQMADYHRQEALRNYPWRARADFSENFKVYWFHRAVANRFRAGLDRPWRFVDDKSPALDGEHIGDFDDLFWGKDGRVFQFSTSPKDYALPPQTRQSLRSLP